MSTRPGIACTMVVRPLRLSVDHHCGVVISELADPLGHGPLVVEHTGERLRLFSAGMAGDKQIERVVTIR